MTSNGIRRGWRLAEIEAGVEFLRGRGFTGEAVYEMAGKGLGSQVTCLSKAGGGVKPQEAEWRAPVGAWLEEPDGSLKIHFSGGVVVRVEH